MNEKIINTSMQIFAIVTLRILMGWHLLNEGISKLFIPNWSSAGFLNESKWILKGASGWIVSHSSVLSFVDIMNTWGLIAIGLGLIFGLFTRIAALSGTLLLLVYYFNNPPLIGFEYSMPSEGNYLIVNKTLIESIALFALAVFPSGLYFGLDSVVYKLRMRIHN